MDSQADTLRLHARNAENMRMPRMAGAIRAAAEQIDTPGFWYLASPYSKFPGGQGTAFRQAAANTAKLIAAGVAVFSPIAHTHSVAIIGKMDLLDLSIWLPADRPMMVAARGCIVLRMSGWDESVGVRHEIEYFEGAGKPVVMMIPGILPPELLG